jgi:anti-anti-sigma factor
MPRELGGLRRQKLAEAWRVSRLQIEVRYEDNIPVIAASGECDLITSRKLRETIDNLISTGHCKIIFDFTNMTYIDSSGFRTLLDAKKKASLKGGDIILVSPSSPVDRVYKLLHLDELIARTDTVADAVQRLMAFNCS